MSPLWKVLWDALEGALRAWSTKSQMEAISPATALPGIASTVSVDLRSGYDRVSSEEAIRKTIVLFAEGQVGEPYRYGASGPATEDLAEWDCSELMMHSYVRAGLAYADGCANQLAQVGHRRVLEPKPGDVFFYGPNASGIPHTGLYTGRGTAINALGGKVGHVVEQPRWDVEGHPRFLGWFRHPNLAYPPEDRA